MTFKKTVLKNGLRIITVPMKDNPTVTAYCLVEAGSKYESKRISGISHFLEHMCFKGTKNRTRDQIVFELDSIGASYNAFTSFEYTGYYAKAASPHALKVLDVVSDIYLNSTFPESEMENEKNVVIEEIKMYEDMPSRKVDEVLLSVMYGDQPAGRSIAGTPEIIRSLKRKEIVKYYEEHYVPEATVVIIAGNFNEGEMISEVKKRFGKIPAKEKATKPKVKENQKNPNVGIFYKKTDQTHLLLGARTFSIYDKRMPVLIVLDHILGGGMSSRLFKKMRDELGICYYIRSSTSEFTDHGIFEVAAGVPEKRLPEAISAILAELKKLTEDEVSDDELKKVKDYIVGHLYMGLESSDSYGSYFGHQEVFRQRIKTPDEWARLIQKVDSAEIKKLASEIFQENKLNLAVVGPTKNKDSLLKVLKFKS